MRTITIEELVAENTYLKTERRWIEETLRDLSLATGYLRLVDTTLSIHDRLGYIRNIVESAKAKGVAEELLRLGGNPKELASFLRPAPGVQADFTYFMGQILSHAGVFQRMSELMLVVK